MAKTSQTFSIDSGLFTSAKVTVGGSTNANALTAILANSPFPSGTISIGQVAVSADTGSISVKTSALPTGASVTFDLSGSAQSGAGVYDKAVDAIAALGLSDPMPVQICDENGRRYLILDFGLSDGDQRHLVRAAFCTMWGRCRFRPSCSISRAA